MRLRTSMSLIVGVVALACGVSAPTFAAMCGPTPATTSPGYHCSNYCTLDCPQRTCSAACCGWTFDPGGGEAWGQTTCGASPYPCEDCGDYSCGGCESPGNCPTDCPSGVFSSNDNYCVVNVQGKVHSLAWRNGTVRRYDEDSSAGGTIVTDENGWPGSYPRTFAQLWDELDDRDSSRCHVQGMGKFPAGAAADFTFDWNRVGGVESELLEYFLGAYCPEEYTPGAPEAPGTLMTKPASSNYVRHAKYFGDLMTQNHPGGMQAIGDYLAVGIDAGGGSSQIYVWYFGNAASPQIVRTFPHPSDRAEAVGVGRLANGKYLFFIGADSGKRMHLYRTQTTSLYQFGWETPPAVDYLGELRAGYNWQGPAKSDFNYNNLAVLKECGSNDLYLAGLTNDDYPDCAGNFDWCDSSIVELHKLVSGSVGGYGLQRLFRVTLDNPCDCFLCTDICPNFAAGGTLEARPDGDLNGYATEHWNDGDDLDVLEW